MIIVSAHTVSLKLNISHLKRNGKDKSIAGIEDEKNLLCYLCSFLQEQTLLSLL